MKFELTESQINMVDLWKDKIKKENGRVGFITYSFTNDGIGIYVSAKSSIKNYRIDLTEYEKF